MRPSTHDRPRYYGNLFNLEHRLMSGAVVVLAVIVLILVGAENRAAQGGQVITLDPPAADQARDLGLEDLSLAGWVRPAEIVVHAPAGDHPVLDERLLKRFRLLEPPRSAPASGARERSSRRNGRRSLRAGFRHSGGVR